MPKLIKFSGIPGLMNLALYAFFKRYSTIFGKNRKMNAIKTSLLLLILSFMACKGEKKESATTADAAEEQDILKKVAYAHGFENWDKVRELHFTFNVDRDTSHFERSWIWKPASGDVTLISGGDTIEYNRKEVDSALAGSDASFINDKFWFLAPYQLMWDHQSFTYELTPDTTAPISGKPMQKLTIVYGDEGGYTPGDAYDLYLDEGHMVREWTFRRGNKPPPGSDATWGGYRDMEGLELATEHEMGGGAAKLYFSGIKVVTNNPE